MSNEAKLAFSKVKPFCVKVAQQRNATVVQELSVAIKQLSSEAVQELHEYLLFPLRVIFLQKSDVKEDAVLSAAECMQIILIKAKVTEWKTFEDLCQILLLQISGSDSEHIFATGSEDVKIAILKTFLSIFKTSLGEHLMLFYRANQIPIIGHMVSIFLSVVANEKHKFLRNLAISVIISFCNAPKPDDDTNCVRIGNCMASFVPGILSALIKVISGDANQGHAVKCKSLEAITKLLKITSSDANIELSKNSAIKNKLLDENVSSHLESIIVNRDQVWINNLSSRLEGVLQHILTATDSANVNVRVEVLNFSHEMLLYCSKVTFQAHLGTLLQIPCKLLTDEVEKVAIKSKIIIENFSSKSENDSVVTNILQEELFDLCTNLPKTFSKSSDSEKVGSLNLLIGLLEVLKFNLKTILYSAVHLDNLIYALVYCFQMDSSELYKVEEVTAVPVNFDHEITTFFKGQSKHWLFKKTFVHFHSYDVCQAAVNLCRILGQYGNLEVLIDNLKERYETEKQRRPVVLIINEIFLGAADNTTSHYAIFDLVDDMLDTYTANENWYLRTSCEKTLTHHSQKGYNTLVAFKQSHSTSDITLKALNSNIILTCLHLEALASFSIVLSLEFRKTLIKTLYPLLEKVNDNNHLINSCALKALNFIALSCQYSSIAALISENADYLVSTISVHLRHLSLFPQSPSVLQAMLSHSHADVFPLVRDTVDEILSTLDLYRFESRYLLAFLPVLMSIVKAIHTWFTANSVKSVGSQLEDESQSICDGDLASDIVTELDDYHTNFKVANLQLTDDMKCESQTSQPPDTDFGSQCLNEDSDEKGDPPAHIKVVEKIMERSSHLLANKDPKVRLIVMNIIDDGVLCLHSENDVLLPLVHKFWNPLIVRCADDELQVVTKAFRVISNLGNCSGTFLRQKFSKDVLPKLLPFLTKHSNPNISVSNKATYSHTTLYKLQLAILNKLGPLLLSSTVSYKELHAVCTACQNYLRSSHPIELQNAAIHFFRHLIKIDPNALWLFLVDIWSSEPIFHSDVKAFKDIAVSGTESYVSEFAANVNHLLWFC